MTLPRSLAAAPRAAVLLLGLACLAGMAPPPGGEAEANLKKAVKANNPDAMVAAIEAMRPATKEQVKLLLEVGAAVPNRDVYVACRDSLATAAADAREELVKALTHGRRFEARVLSADSIGCAADDAAAQDLARALEDSDVPVRIAAIRSLAHLERRACVDVLVARLQKANVAQGGAEVEELYRALLHLTGQTLEAPADWKNWWSTQPPDFDPKTRANPAGEGAMTTHTRGGKIFESAVASRAFVLVLDISSSMRVIDLPPGQTWTDDKGAAHNFKDPGMGTPDESSRFRRAQREFTQFIASIDASVRFSIVVFGDDVRAWKDELVAASPANKAQATQFVQALQWQPATCTDAALERAFSIAGADTIYLFSDGIPERRVNGANVDIPQDEVVTKAQALNLTRKVRLNCFGFATVSPVTREFLRRLATSNDGEYKDIR